MSTLSIEPALQRLHELAWRPGASMHTAWWAHLSLDPWRASYRRHPRCRDALDRLIVARRGFPRGALGARPDSRACALLALEPRFDSLIVALGLVALACPDHVLMKPHRAALAPHLGPRACDQLVAICPRWHADASVVAPDALVEAAFLAGARWWQRDAHRDLAALLIGTLLPPSSGATTAPDDSAIDWLTRMARFL